MKMRRLCAYIMALLLAASMPLTAVAEDYDLVIGSVTVNASEGEQTVTQENNPDRQNYADSSPNISSSSTTSNTVTINADAGSTAKVTLDGVNINSDGAAILTSGGGNVVIELDGENMVQSGDQHAGVEKQNSGKLTITDEDGGGSLTANGGDGGAGIGGKIESGASDITISDGKVTATGGEGGAGIGGGAQGGNGSNITISGGTVNATGGENAAGIGGGSNGNGSNITISGGTVNATGGNPPIIGSGDALEFGEGGGAGIGGGAYGEGNNITVKFNAQVTAKGKGHAANIGNGTSEKATEKQKDKVDLSGLSSFGKVNGVSGGDGGYHASNGSSSSGGSSGGQSFGKDVTTKVLKRSTLTVSMGELEEAEGKPVPVNVVEEIKTDNTLTVTALADSVLVTGNQADLLQLKEDGVKKINLQTNRVNVSVSNQVLDKITDSGGGFQLAADDTTVSISSTGGNNQQESDLKLTADKQPEKGKLQVNFRLAEFKEGAGDVRESLNTTLQVSTNAPEATLSYNRKFLNALMNSEFGKLGLAVGNLLATVDGMLGAITTVNGSGSISIGNNTVNMNGIQFSAADSSENNKLDDVLNEIKLKMENNAQSGSVLVAEVDAKAAMASASLKVPGSALQSLMDQGVAETALSVNGKTTSFKNSNLLKQIQDSRLGSTATVTDKHIANDESKTWSEKVVKDGNVIISADDLL